MTRAEILEQLAASIAAVRLDHPTRVAIDGVDGSGTTTLADELVKPLRRAGREVIRASVDGFHHPRAVRYTRGPDSPEGYYLDSFDYAKSLNMPGMTTIFVNLKDTTKAKDIPAIWVKIRNMIGPREPRALEGVRRRGVGERQKPVADEFCHRGADIERARVADHGIAEIETVGPCFLDGLDEARHRFHLPCGAQVTGDDAGDTGRAATLDQRPQRGGEAIGIEHDPLGSPVARVVRQDHCGYGPDREAETLQRKNHGAVSHRAARHMARDGDDGAARFHHDQITLRSKSGRPAAMRS